MRSAAYTGSLLLALTSLTGCGCEPVLATSVSPGREVTLHPGEAITLVYAHGGGSCGGSAAHPEMRFLSSDTLVARVDSMSGRLTAVRTGEATVWLNYAEVALTPTSYSTEVLVHVR